MPVELNPLTFPSAVGRATRAAVTSAMAFAAPGALARLASDSWRAQALSAAFYRAQKSRDFRALLALASSPRGLLFSSQAEAGAHLPGLAPFPTFHGGRPVDFSPLALAPISWLGPTETTPANPASLFFNDDPSLFGLGLARVRVWIAADKPRSPEALARLGEALEWVGFAKKHAASSHDACLKDLATLARKNEADALPLFAEHFAKNAEWSDLGRFGAFFEIAAFSKTQSRDFAPGTPLSTVSLLSGLRSNRQTEGEASGLSPAELETRRREIFWADVLRASNARDALPLFLAGQKEALDQLWLETGEVDACAARSWAWAVASLSWGEREAAAAWTPLGGTLLGWAHGGDELDAAIERINLAGALGGPNLSARSATNPLGPSAPAPAKKTARRV
jgi:hypothetical protein